MQQSGQVTLGEVSTLFAYNESYDGVKQAANYDVYNNNGRFIVVKSGAVTVPMVHNIHTQQLCSQSLMIR